MSYGIGDVFFLQKQSTESKNSNNGVHYISGGTTLECILNTFAARRLFWLLIGSMAFYDMVTRYPAKSGRCAYQQNQADYYSPQLRLTLPPVCAFGSSTKHEADWKRRGLDADNDAIFAAGLVGWNRLEAKWTDPQKKIMMAQDPESTTRHLLACVQKMGYDEASEVYEVVSIELHILRATAGQNTPKVTASDTPSRQ